MAEVKPYLIAVSNIIQAKLNAPYLIAVSNIIQAKLNAPYLIAITEPSDDTTVKCDLLRNTVVAVSSSLDTVKSTTIDIQTTTSTNRSIITDIAVSGDLKRAAVADEIVIVDILRVLSAQTEKDSVTADTNRNTVVSIISNSVTDRHIQVDYVVNIDALRKFSKSEHEQLTFDTARHTVVTVTIQADIKVLHGILEDVSVSTKRTLIKSVINLVSMIRRMPFDTSFIPANRPQHSDPFHIWPKEKPKSGMISMEISLNELSLSDTFRLETAQPVDILNVIKGTIIDYQYQYVIDALDFKDLTRTAGGMYDCDAMLYSPITYNWGKEETHTLYEHALMISVALGKRLNYKADNWEHTSTWSGNGNTYSSIISTLFGWSSTVPQRQMNVFIRAKDNSFNVLQRGRESNTVDLTDLSHSKAEYHREIERTLWSTTDADRNSIMCGKLPNVTVNYPDKNGNSSGGGSASYDGEGLLSYESNENGTTYYSYIGTDDGYKLSHKSTRNYDGSGSDTDYQYTGYSGSVSLLWEEETQYDKNGKQTHHRFTQHNYLGNGATSTSVWEDGKSAGSSVTIGGLPSISTEYSKRVASGSLGNHKGSIASWDNDKVLDDDMFPTNNPYALAILHDAIRWLNRKIKETITMEIYNFNHAIDFTDRVRFKGNDYFLVSNTITQTTRELKQRITAVRWY